MHLYLYVFIYTHTYSLCIYIYICIVYICTHALYICYLNTCTLSLYIYMYRYVTDTVDVLHIHAGRAPLVIGRLIRTLSWVIGLLNWDIRQAMRGSLVREPHPVYAIP